jgi:N-acetylmuramoyl-L-alanine amidase CwlA
VSEIKALDSGIPSDSMEIMIKLCKRYPTKFPEFQRTSTVGWTTKKKITKMKAQNYLSGMTSPNYGKIFVPSLVIEDLKIAVNSKQHNE